MGVNLAQLVYDQQDRALVTTSKLSVAAWDPFFLADVVCRALGIPRHVAIAIASGDVPQSWIQAHWVGPTDPRDTHYPVTVSQSLVLLAGLQQQAAVVTDLIKTPLPAFRECYPYVGGVAQDTLSVVVQGGPPRHNQVLAALLLYDTLFEKLCLHHAGFRFSTEADFVAAQQDYAADALLRRPASDHLRVYVPLKLCLGTSTYREFQWWPEHPNRQHPAAHLDVVVAKPRDFLIWLAAVCDANAVFFETSGPNEPIGMVKVVDGADSEVLMVMAREQWWRVEDAET